MQIDLYFDHLYENNEDDIIFNSMKFKIHLPDVVAVDGAVVFEVVVTVVLVVGVVEVISVIKLYIE